MYQLAGERETRQKSVSLPPKAGELAPLHLGVANGTSKNVGLEKIWVGSRNISRKHF